jgi:hypothetical protein
MCHLQFSLQAASPENFGYTLVLNAFVTRLICAACSVHLILPYLITLIICDESTNYEASLEALTAPSQPQRMRGASRPLPQYAFMAWCIVKHRDNFTFMLI